MKIENIKRLLDERYSAANAVFWAGSTANGTGNQHSDIDLVIVFKHIAHAYREAFMYDNVPFDVFIHDIKTLEYFFEESRVSNGISGLIYMIINGVILKNTDGFADIVKTTATQFFQSGPVLLSREQVDKERFLITDILDDIKFPVSRDEQITSAVHMFEPLLQFYFRAQGKWSASGKSLIRSLKQDNPELSRMYLEAFEDILIKSCTIRLESIVETILEPYGGLLWNGFRSDSPKLLNN